MAEVFTTGAGASVAPSLDDVAANRRALDRLICETPVIRFPHPAGGGFPDVWLKLEALQVTGSFKPRGAWTVIRHLTPEQLRRGLVTVSSGNHAIALAEGARLFGSTATIYMAAAADPYRIERARALGARVELMDDIRLAFEAVDRDVATHGRCFVHPFEGPWTTLGTASIALELHRQLPQAVDTFVVAIGGGSLASGLAPTIKALRPGARVIGIEPVGAPTLSRSIAAGRPLELESIDTIADSLAPPFAAPYSMGLVRDYVDEIVLIDDRQIVAAMRLMVERLKLAIEPAGAAALAGVLAFPARFRPETTCVMVCGSNIGLERYSRMLASTAAIAVD
jgi:threonine dehydratase